MLTLVIGLAIFFAIHLVPTAPDVRNGLARRMGEGTWKIVFSVVSLVGFALIVLGWSKLGTAPGKNPVLWVPPAWGRHVAMGLMPFAFILLAAAYVPSRIRAAARHPMLLAVKLWAVAHLLVRGDLASLILFGSFLAYAVFDLISAKKRAALGPLGKREGGLGGDVLAVAIGLGAFALMLLWGHARLIGIPLVPGWA